MKRLFAIAVSVLFALTLVMPVAAHDGEHESEPPSPFTHLDLEGDTAVLSTCEGQVELLFDLFFAYNLGQIEVMIVDGDSPEHDLLHLMYAVTHNGSVDADSSMSIMHRTCHSYQVCMPIGSPVTSVWCHKAHCDSGAGGCNGSSTDPAFCP